MSLYGNGWWLSVHAPLNLDHDVVVGRQRQQLREFGPGFGRRRRLEGLLQPKMVDHQPCLGMARRHLADLVQPTPAQQVDRKGMAGRRRQHAADAGMGSIGRDVRIHHDSNGNRALRVGPFGDRVAQP